MAESGLPAPRYRGAVIIVLTVAVPLAPQRVENLVRRQITVFPPSLLKMRIAVDCEASLHVSLVFCYVNGRVATA